MDKNDYSSVIDIIQKIFMSADRREWQECRNCFVKSPFIDYSSLNGQEPSFVNADDLIKGWENFLPGFKFTMHMLSNFDIKISGSNKAEAYFYGHAIHNIPVSEGGDLWGVYGTYNCGLTKEGNDWKVSSLKFNLLYQEGNKSLPAIAANKKE